MNDMKANRVVSCCVYGKPPKVMQNSKSNIQNHLHLLNVLSHGAPLKNNMKALIR